MKKILMVLFLFVLSVNYVFANENIDTKQAEQIIEMEDNKINVIVMKQPLNEQSSQKITLRRNWLGVYVQINGKVRVNPLTNTYEVE